MRINNIDIYRKDMISNDTEFIEYPYYKKNIYELLEGDILVDKDKNKIGSDVLKGKIFGVYFSSSYCPTCKCLNPILTKVCNNLKEKGIDFPIITTTLEDYEDAFNEYFSSLGFYAIPVKDERALKLYKSEEVTGTPCLILYDNNGNKIRKDGKDAIINDENGYPWKPEAILDISTNPHQINEETCVICLTDNNEEMIKEYQKVSEEMTREGLSFIIGKEENNVTKQIRGLTHIEYTPALFIIDIPQEYFNIIF